MGLAVREQFDTKLAGQLITHSIDGVPRRLGKPSALRRAARLSFWECPPPSKTRRGCPAEHSPRAHHRPDRHRGYFARNGSVAPRQGGGSGDGQLWRTGLAAGDAAREAAAWRPTVPAKSRGRSLRSHPSPAGYRSLPGRGCRAFVRVSTTLADDGPPGPIILMHSASASLMRTTQVTV
jgi:hypothetical protein